MDCDCPDCGEEIECGCGNPNSRPPCHQCVEHVCYAEADECRLVEMDFNVAEAKDAVANGRAGDLDPEKMLIDLEWALDALDRLGVARR